MKTAIFADALKALLDETFDSHNGIYLDKGTSLFETLDGVTAADASRSSGTAASIAAHVIHMTFYLDVLERYIKSTLAGPIDWRAIWRNTQAVTPAEWDEIRSTLHSTSTRIRAMLAQRTDWDDERAVGGALAILAHTSYHLGSIRHAIKCVAAPAATPKSS